MNEQDLKKLAELMTPELAKAMVANGERGIPDALKSAQNDTTPKGYRLGRYIKGLGYAKLTNGNVLDVLKAQNSTDIAKSMTFGTSSSGGSLVPQPLAAEFIDALHARSVVRKAGARTVQMPNGNLSFGRATAAATAYYEGEATDAPASGLTTDSLKLTEKKLITIVPVSNDLLRNAPGSEAFIEEDVANVAAAKEDAAFLVGDGASDNPTGILVQATQTAIAASAVVGKPTYAEMKAALYKARSTMIGANAPMVKPVWFFNSDVELALLSGVASGGTGATSFEQEMLTKGTLLGFPYFVSTQIPWTGVTDQVTKIGLVDMSEVVIGENLVLEIELFPNAAFKGSSGVVSGVSSDQSVIRALAKHDIGLRHSASAVCLTGIDWNQPA